MQLNNIRSGSVLQGGVAESKQFTMAANGKMFRLLSDTLYQNKIGSMIREISCNAVDAHIAAGKPDVPFVIHAPNQLEPWFSVTDQGIGLSHEDVTTIFTCFGMSTKASSNDMVGAFGFGSKTPFAYTDTFTVTSVKDGVRSCYAAVVGEDDIPVINLMDSSETTDPNGVEINVAVNAYDFREFYTEIEQQLRFFRVKPVIKGANITFADPYANVVEKIDDSTYFRKRGSVQVVQGGVAYPVDINQLCKNMDKATDLYKFIQRAVYNYGPLLMFDIGQIAVTPSREAISYDAPTIKNILDRLSTVHTLVKDRINAKMLAIPNVWDRTKALRENADFYSHIFDLSKNTWGVTTSGNDAYIFLDNTITDAYDTGSGRVFHSVTCYKQKQHISTFRLEANELRERLYPKDNTIIVIDDGVGAAPARLRRYIEETNKTVYYFHANERKVIARHPKKDMNGNETIHVAYADNLVAAAIDPTIFAKFLDKVDGAEIVYLSDLPKPERVITYRANDGTVVKERVKYTPAKAYRFTGFDSHFRQESLRNFDKTFEAPKKMSDAAAYVVLKDRAVDFALSDDDMALFRATLNSDEFKTPVYAIREKDLPKIAKNPNWKQLKDVVADVRKELMAKYKFKIVRAALNDRGDSLHFFNTYLANWLRAQRDKLLDPELRKALTRLKVNRTRYGAVCELLYKDELEKLVAKVVAQNNTLNENLKVRYDFVRSAFGHYYVPSEDHAAMVIDIMNTCYKKTVASN